MKLLTLTIIILIVILQDSIFIWKINKLNGENWFFKHETLEKSFGMALCRLSKRMLGDHEYEMCLKCDY